MAGNESGDFSPCREGKIEEEMLPPPLPPDDGDQTSDVCASLFKDMISEEEMEEVAPGRQDDIQIVKEGGSYCNMPDADTARDSSGEEGSVFQGIGEEDFTAQQSGYVGTPISGTEVFNGLCSGGSGIADEVPFIRTDRRELDDIGSLPAGYGSLRVEDDEYIKRVSKAEEMESQTGKKSKEEISSLAGIIRDYGTSAEEGGEDVGLISLAEETSCGEERVKDGAFFSLADDNEDGGQDSTLILPENTPNQLHESLCLENVSVEGLEMTCVSQEDKPSTSGAGQLTEDQESYEMPGEDKIPSESTPKPRVRKRGRPTRELGALLMDGTGRRRGNREFELQGACTVASGQLSEREAADSIAPSGRIAVLSAGSMSQVRITRSQASGRYAIKDGIVDSKVEIISLPDVPAKRTGKRSVTRGGRPGWGNTNESCPQNLEMAANAEEKMFVLNEGTGEDISDVHMIGEIAKSKGKSGGKGKKSPGLFGTECIIGKAEPEEKSVSGEMFIGPVTRGPDDVDGSKPAVNHSDETNASSMAVSVQQGAICTQHSEEIKALDVDGVLEDTKVVRRRSNRQTAKAAKKAEECETASGYAKLKKNSKARKRSSEGGRKKVEEVLGGAHLNQQTINAEDVAETCSTPGNVTSKCGDSGNDINTGKFSLRRSTGRKPAKEKQKTDAVNLVTQKKGTAVSGKCNVGKGKGGGRSRVKQNATELASVPSVNQESECKKGMGKAEDDGGCLKGISSPPENDNVGADRGSDKNTSSITADIKEVRQGQEKLQDSPKLSTVTRDFETSDHPGSKLDSKEDAECQVRRETCNPSACVDPVEQFSEGIDRNLVGSSWTVKLVSEISHENDATIGGRVSLIETDDRPKSPSIHGNGKDAEGDGSRESPDNTGYATSCDSLVKKESGVAIFDEAVTPSPGLADNGGCGDLIFTTETAKVNVSPGTRSSGQTRVRQRKGIQQQAGTKLGTQTSRKGRKGSIKNGFSNSDDTSIPLEETASTRSKKNKVSTRRDRKKCVLEMSDKEDVAVLEASKILDAVNLPAKEDGLDEANEEQIGGEAEDKLAGSGSEVEISRRRNVGVSGPPSQSSLPLELVSDKCEMPLEARRVAGSKPSRKLQGGQKKPKKAPVPGVGAVAYGAQRKNESRRSSRAKGATIKALLSVKEKIRQVASGVKGGTGDVHTGAGLRNESDAAHSLEVVENSVNVECVEGTQVREGIDSPDDTAAAGEDMSSGVTQGDGTEDIERRAEAGVFEDDVPRKSWVLCDDCNKWRCIPVELADEIDDTNAKWSCRDNPNPDFADCSIPQEKSNAEINAELQISEISGSEDEDDNDGIESKLMEIGTRGAENKPAVWKMIRRNIFRHRRAKTQGSDEVMICQCTPPEDGGVGCGDNCLNRVLNIECVQEYCPCGEACSNQQFQKRMYAPVATFRCGKKGFGLKVLKNLPKDSFLIEYVGEVLDVNAFEKRQEEYARIGQKHFYFMTLNSTEVIDACSKGNLGRFINHSCEPNCKTEKWMVNGEVCIGLFAIRDIGEGEEVTFDYNYVRVRGASAKKCECGSSQCRGFIGTDSETPRDEIVESDSDEEDLEPIMIVNSDEEDNHVRPEKVTSLKKQKDDKVYQEPTRPSRIKRKLVALKEKGTVSVKRMKTTGSSSIKKLSSSNPKGLTVDTGVGRHEGGRALSSDVQEKLDDLLDDTGGLKKKKDVPKQYLRLLYYLLSIASGDNEKDASACSVRDISLLLEALLRTWSRSVLSGIMKMNGFRMLHGFIKQLRWQWDKTPILRKLMKVLEHLSSDRVSVLTQNMINSAAPNQGIESFSESLFELTRHRDPEVCLMARRFRYKWIPPRPPVYEQYNKGVDRPPQPLLKSVSPVKISSQTRDDSHVSSSRKQSPNIACLEGSEASKSVNGLSSVSSTLTDGAAARQGKTPLPSVPQTDTAVNVKRKRVSRWDAPAKVPKGTYEPVVGGSSADLPGVNSTLSGRQTSVPLVAPVHSAGAQFQSQGSREPFSKKQKQFGPTFQNGTASSPFRTAAPVTCSSEKQGVKEVLGASSNLPGKGPPNSGRQPDFPGMPGSWPPATSSVNQDPPRLPFGVTSGQPQIPSGCAPVFTQGRPDSLYGIPAQPHLPQVHGPFPVPPAIPPNRLPPHVAAGAMPQHVGPHQVSAPNGVTLGGVGFPANVYPGCPPLHMCLGGPPLQVVNGMAPSMPLAYPQGVHYGHWGPGVGMPHFAGPPAFSSDDSRRYLPQPMWQNTSSCRENGLGGRMDQRISTGKVLPSKGDSPSGAGVKTAPNVEAEPPVPGLSPPLSSFLDTQDSAGVNPCTREPTQEKAIPGEFRDSRWHDENYEVPETRRDGEHGPDHYSAVNSEVRESESGFHEERWGDPECQSFRDNVFSLVRSRVGRHKLRTRDVDKFCSKLADVIVRKEVARYIETKNRGCEKIIVRSKLVRKVESFVDREVENFSRKFDRNQK
ncbi:hypothetical protein R1flu_028587 [Riccia fluitans]|uniref:Histone-lysine N-methyltransferase n=1 Tax=Riccia fluitans TaxID=41844 RepID=A0ABD1XM43_9MARC